MNSNVLLPYIFVTIFFEVEYFGTVFILQFKVSSHKIFLGPYLFLDLLVFERFL